MKDYDVIAMESRLKLANALKVDDGGTVNANKPRRIEFLFEGRQRFADEMTFLAHMEIDVVSGCLDPINVGDADEIDPAGSFDHQTFRGGPARFDRVQQFLE